MAERFHVKGGIVTLPTGFRRWLIKRLKIHKRKFIVNKFAYVDAIMERWKVSTVEEYVREFRRSK